MPEVETERVTARAGNPDDGRHLRAVCGGGKRTGGEAPLAGQKNYLESKITLCGMRMAIWPSTLTRRYVCACIAPE